MQTWRISVVLFGSSPVVPGVGVSRIWGVCSHQVHGGFVMDGAESVLTAELIFIATTFQGANNWELMLREALFTYICYFIKYSPCCNLGVIIPILQMRKLRSGRLGDLPRQYMAVRGQVQSFCYIHDSCH